MARTRYDDGGFSGGNIERPALQRLLADIRGGRIDIIVVYKVDRLTRSLTDFARLVFQCRRRRVGCQSVLFQAEEERPRPRRAGDLSRDRGQQAVLRALPAEAVIEDHDLVGLFTCHSRISQGPGLQLRGPQRAAFLRTELGRQYAAWTDPSVHRAKRYIRSTRMPSRMNSSSNQRLRFAQGSTHLWLARRKVSEDDLRLPSVIADLPCHADALARSEVSGVPNFDRLSP